MAIKSKEQAIIDLVINGQQAKASLQELAGSYNAAWAAASKLRQADDPKKYEEVTRQVKLLKEARDAERASILSSGAATKGFFADFKKGFSEINEMAGKITAGTLIYKAVSYGIEGVKEFFSGTVQAYEEAQRTQTQLQTVIKSTGGIAGETKTKLEEYQQVLMNQTGVDDDVIAKGEEMLLTFTNIRGRIYEQALPAIVDMTAALNGGNVTMEGIQKTSIQVGKALNDPIAGMVALKKVGVTLNDQQKDQIKTLVKSNDVMGAQTIILKELQKEFGGTAKAVADTDVGALQKFETRIGNIKENVGKFIVGLKSAQATALEPFVTWLEKITTTKVSETLEKDRISLMANQTQLDSSNLSHEARVTIIKKLKEQYPEYLGNINAEKVSNSQLLPILGKINEALVLRIAYSKKSEGLSESMQKEADAMLRMDKYSENLAKTMAIIRSKFSDKGIEIVTPSGLTNIQQANFLLNKIKENKGKFLNTELAYQDLSVAATYVEQYTAAYKSAGAERTKYLNDQQRFAKQYGFNPDGDDPAQAQYKKDHPVINPTNGLTSNDQAAAQKKLEAFNKELENTRTEANKLAEAAKRGTVDDLDAQIKVIQDKYKKVIDEINKLMKDPHATAAIKKELSNRIGTLKSDETLEEKNTAENYRKAQEEKAKKDREEELKGASGRIDNIYNQGQSDLDRSQDDDLNAVSGPDPETVEAKRLNVQALYAQKKYELEQNHLEDMKLLYSAYGKDTGDLDKKIADNTIKENARAAKKKEADDKAYIAAKKTVSQLELDTVQQGAQLLESILDKRSALYKAALIVDKTVAIANIAMSTEVAIAKFTASVAGLGPVGIGLATAYGIAAHISEGLSIAAVIKSVVDGFSGDSSTSSTGKKAAKGGYFEGAGHDQGGLNVVDPKTGNTVVNVEGDEPWMVLSRETRRNNGALINQLLYNSMYRNGAQVDMAAVSKGIQVAKNGGLFNSNSTSAPNYAAQSTSGLPNNYEDRLARTEEHIRLVAELLESETKRPIVFNNRVYKKQIERDAQIDNSANS